MKSIALALILFTSTSAAIDQSTLWSIQVLEEARKDAALLNAHNTLKEDSRANGGNPYLFYGDREGWSPYGNYLPDRSE